LRVAVQVPAPIFQPAVDLDTGDASPGRFVAWLRRIHLSMIDAVVAGDGPARVAEIAAHELGAGVALVVPALQMATAAPDRRDERLAAVTRYVGDRVIGRPTRVPIGVHDEAPIATGGRLLGAVVLLGAPRRPGAAHDVLQLAALAAVSAVALETSAEGATEQARAALIADIQTRPEMDVQEILARARWLGCDLSEGAVALCADPPAGRLDRVTATIAEEFPSALSARRDGRLYALLPARPDRDAAATTAVALRVTDRLKSGTDVGLSAFAAAPTGLQRLLREAELAQALVRSGAVDARELVGGTYRLLLAVAISDPAELEAFETATLAPVAEHDARTGSGLLETFAAYLHHGCNMNATGAAIYLHRHTVAYRLRRIGELSGVDPSDQDGRERLGLALKARQVAQARRGL
jgi:sugar diacid utilization regulator